MTSLMIACSTNPITQRQQFKLVPEAELMTMANTEYQTFLSTNTVLAPSNNRDAEMVRRVGQRITRAVTDYYTAQGIGNELANYQWDYKLVQDKSANAWCMPGGKIVVYTGLLPITQNEAALAAVVAHEVSHAIFNHGNERMSQGLIQQLGGVALSVALANKPAQTQNLFQTAYGLTSNVGVILPFARKHELEADRYGLWWMAMAGYNPREAIGLWDRMEAASGGSSLEFLSTHPSEGKRKEQLNKYMDEALQFYKPVGN